MRKLLAILICALPLTLTACADDDGLFEESAGHFVNTIK